MGVFKDIDIDIESEVRRDPELFLVQWSSKIPDMPAVMRHCSFEVQWLYGLFYEQEDERRHEIFPDELLERYFPLVPPKEGSFIGYKKAEVYDEFINIARRVIVIVTLEIPENAKRSSSITRKCRCSRAKVLHIEPLIDNSVDRCPEFLNEENIVAQSAYVNPAVAFGVSYKVGETVYADKWDSDRWHECSHGIHFFMTREEAEQY